MTGIRFTDGTYEGLKTRHPADSGIFSAFQIMEETSESRNLYEILPEREQSCIEAQK